MPDYGYRSNAARDNYIVDEDAMQVVRRIFYMVGVENRAIHAVKRIFEYEGLLTPTGAKYWNVQFIRTRILDDVYRPHTYGEVAELVAPEVAAKLDPDKRYGIYWFNRYRRKRTQVSESGPNGRYYRQQAKTTLKPRDEWIAVPIPDSGIPREWVDAARDAIQHNRRPSSAGRRFWELSGGVLRCGDCGRSMLTTSTLGRGRWYHYYRCFKHVQGGVDACAQKKNLRAEMIEGTVWETVAGLLKDPERLRDDLDAMIEEERNGLHRNPNQETNMWLEKLAETDRMRSGYQDLAAKGLMTYEELGEKLRVLEETRKTAERELQVLQGRRERIEELERNKDAMLESYAALAPEALDSLMSEERHRVYKMLRLKVVAAVDGNIEVTGVLGDDLSVCASETTTSRPSIRTPGRREPIS